MYQPQLHQQFIDQRRNDLERRATRFRQARRTAINGPGTHR